MIGTYFNCLSSQRADMTARGMVPINSRRPYMDFTTPFKYYTHHIVYYQDRKQHPPTITVMLSPFRVWFFLFNSEVSSIFYEQKRIDRCRILFEHNELVWERDMCLKKVKRDSSILIILRKEKKLFSSSSSIVSYRKKFGDFCSLACVCSLCLR